MRGRAWLPVFVLLLLAGCGDKVISLAYALTSVDDLEKIMNEALNQFVQRVITDPDITARLYGDKRPE
jgi:predicted RecB family endonuclease